MEKVQRELAEKYFKSMLHLKRHFQNLSFHSLDKYKLTHLQMHAIHYIGATPGISVGDLAEQMMMSSASVAQLTERLVKMKWISRENDKDDKRIIRLSMTAEGKKNAKQIKDAALDEMSNLMALIPQSDLEELIRINTILSTKLESIQSHE